MFPASINLLNFSFPVLRHDSVRCSAGSSVVRPSVLNSLLAINVSSGLLRSLLLVVILLVLLTGDASY